MKPIPLLLLLTTSVLFVSAPCPAQQTDRAAAVRIDRLVRQQMAENKIPGVSLAVLRNGKMLLLKSYGLANVEHQVPVKPETIFQSGSMGKQFTAAAVMILAQENKLSLDDKISKYFSDAPTSWKDITIRHLLRTLQASIASAYFRTSGPSGIACSIKTGSGNRPARSQPTERVLEPKHEAHYQHCERNRNRTRRRDDTPNRAR